MSLRRRKLGVAWQVVRLAGLSGARYTLPVTDDHICMEDELVLLTSYFNLAGGRRQDNAATFRVDPSLRSATSPDGVAALYVVTESTTGGQMGPRARKLAADTVVQEYAAHSDAPPATRLRSGLKACHEAILREFEGHVSVGLSVVAVERDSIYLAQVAPGQVYVVHAGGLHSVSAAVEGSSPFSRALGASAGPKITVFRDQIGPGDVLALTSSWFHRAADPEEIRDCFSAGTADDVAQCILEMAKQHDVRDASVIVIEAALGSELEVESDDDPAPSFVEQLDTAVASLAGVGRMIWDEFRTTPPIENPDELGLGRRRSRQDSSSTGQDGSGVASARAGVSASPRPTGAARRSDDGGASTINSRHRSKRHAGLDRAGHLVRLRNSHSATRSSNGRNADRVSRTISHRRNPIESAKMTTSHRAGRRRHRDSSRKRRASATM